MFLFKAVAFLIPIYYLLSYIKLNILPDRYLFDHKLLQEISQKALKENPGASSSEIIQAVYKELKAEYGDYINDFDPNEWVFNNAGNAMGTMLVLHASITEYLIFFGTAVGTEGHTGTHFADDYFTILHGEQTAAYPNSTVPERYLPGDQHHLPSGYNKQYRMPEDAWALELAQGYIPSMLPFGMLEALTSTMDWFSFGKTVRISAVNIVQNLMKGKI